MRVFVTGGSGFVGGRLIEALKARKIEVRALARSHKAASKIEWLGVATVRGDLGDVEAMAAGMEGCELVFHGAAKVETWGDAADFERVNVGGTLNVIEAARRAGVKRLIHVSTEAVLAGAPIIDATEGSPYPAKPAGLYPASKGAAERLVRGANGADLETVVVRPRFIWGKGDTSVLPQLVDAVRRGRFKWIGGGEHLTSTCHVDNVVEGLILAASKGAPGGVYFLTDGPPMRNRDFVSRLLKTQRVPSPTQSVPLWLAKLAATLVELVWKLLPIDDAPPLNRTEVALFGEQVTVDDSRARAELGYTAAKSLEAGLAEMEP